MFFLSDEVGQRKFESYRPGDIVRQIKADINQGCKEICFRQQTMVVMEETLGSNLASLLQQCCELDGEFKIRIGMMNPMYIPQLLSPYRHSFA